MYEMDGFSSDVSECPGSRLGVGAYNREQRATILRLFGTEKDSMWGAGLRAPIGNRIAHSSSDSARGAISHAEPGGDFLTLVD